MASIKKMNGKFKVNINKKGFPRLSKRFLDKKTAKLWANEIEIQMEKGEFQSFNAVPTTLREVLIKYREEKTIHKKGFREETVKINLLLKDKITSHSMMQLRSHHIHELMKELIKTRKPNTVNKYIHIISHAWKVSKQEWGLTLPRDNPFDMVTKYKYNDQRDRILTKQEYKDLLVEAESSPLIQLKDIIQILYLTGCRRGELLRLSKNNINFEKRTMTFLDTKNGEDRTIPISDQVLKILKRYPFGKKLFPISTYRLSKFWRRAKENIGIKDFRLHDLRACFCTNAFLSGLTVAEVATLSGHKDWSQLRRYTRIKPEDLIDKVNRIVAINNQY